MQREEDLCKKAAELEQAKQRTDEAHKIVSIIDIRSDNSTPKRMHDSDETRLPSQLQQQVSGPNTGLQGETDPTNLQTQQTFVPAAPTVEAKMTQPPTQDTLIPSTSMVNMYPTHNTLQQTFIPGGLTVEANLTPPTQDTLIPSTHIANMYPTHNTQQQTFVPSATTGAV